MSLRLRGLLLAPMVLAYPPAPPDFALRDGDRVLFYGDSITEANGYAAFVETFAVTRFPERKIEFVNAGWGGDTVEGGRGGDIETRLRRDVEAAKPTVITLMLGMNDGGVQPFDEARFERFRRGYRAIVDRFREVLPDPKRITLIKPSPYDDLTRAPSFEGGYNSVLQRYGGAATTLAKNLDLGLADFNQPMLNLIDRAKALEPDLALQLLPDRVHPSPAAHLVMATALLQAWNAPSVVTAVEIDAATARTTIQTRTTVRDLRIEGRLEWGQEDRSLPFPTPRGTRISDLIRRAAPQVEALNVQMLRVTNLPAERYRLRIDEVEVGTFSRGQLDRSLNLTQFETPMLAQARRVHAITLERAAIRQARWRAIEVALAGAPSPARDGALRAMEELEAETVRRQRAAAQPAPTRYVLEPMGPTGSESGT